MKIRINGMEREFDAVSPSIEDLLRLAGLEGLPVIVERNGRALVRSEWGVEPVGEGDVIEIVRLAAGG